MPRDEPHPSASLLLPPEPASSGRARRFLAGHLEGAPVPVRQQAELLVSELVTNALLHAGTPVTLSLHRGPDALRVEVSDSNPVLPVMKHYALDAGTGRGLGLVEQLSSRWGARRAGPGKIVWFELALHPDGASGAGGGDASRVRPTRVGTGFVEPAPTPAPSPPPPPPRARRSVAGTARAPAPDALVTVRLLHSPVLAMIRTEEQYDALYREFRLMLAQDPSQGSSVPGRLLALIDELGPRSPAFGGPTAQRQWNHALARGDEFVDLEALFPRAAGAAVARYDRLLDEADDYCRRAELLTVAPAAEAVAVRKWAFGEVTRQCGGGQPRPWAP